AISRTRANPRAPPQPNTRMPSAAARSASGPPARAARATSWPPARRPRSVSRVWRSPPRQPFSRFRCRMRTTPPAASRLARRPFPARHGLLPHPRQGEFARGRIPRQRRARAQRGALAHAHRRDQLGIRPDEGIVLDHGLELVDAIVIAGDGARADVDALADLGI